MYNPKAVKTKSEIQDVVTANYITLAEFVVKKTGPIKTFKQFADITGTGTNFSMILKGSRNAPLESAVIACLVFGCSIEWMFTNNGEMFGKENFERQLLDLQERVSKIERKIKLNKCPKNDTETI